MIGAVIADVAFAVLPAPATSTAASAAAAAIGAITVTAFAFARLAAVTFALGTILGATTRAVGQRFFALAVSRGLGAILAPGVGPPAVAVHVRPALAVRPAARPRRPT